MIKPKFDKECPYPSRSHFIYSWKEILKFDHWKMCVVSGQRKSDLNHKKPKFDKAKACLGSY